MSQPSVDFYLLKELGLEQSYNFVCRLTDKAYQQNHNLYIHVSSAQEAKALDDLLWVFRDTSFIPHGISGTIKETPPPVQIGFNHHPTPPYNILVNLTTDIPEFYKHFKRVLEIVPQDNQWKEFCRKKYKLYRDKNCEVTTHDLTKN